MKKAGMLKVVNVIVTILFVNQVATGFLHGALPYRAFVVLHQRGAIVFAVAIIVHVVLNWNWVRVTFRRKSHATARRAPAPDR
jgi:hypothetical protein